MSVRIYSIVSFCILLLSSCTKTTEKYTGTVPLVPLPVIVELQTNSIELTAKQMNALKVRNISEVATVKIDSTLANEYYSIEISKNAIAVKTGGRLGRIYATTTLLQLLGNGTSLPLGYIEDAPSHEYRGLMMDLSRNWHNIETLEQLIDLASWYKINYLHMHLTDDGLFTFKSKQFPSLATEKHYTLQELKALNEYAYSRGVTLLPEIDMPGHSSAFIRAMPSLFGLEKPETNGYTLNIGKPEVYEAIDVIISELVTAFPYSPYIHIGGDEVFTEGFAEDPHIQKYMTAKGIKTLDDLYRHFLVRVTRMVIKKGKTPMMWSGFSNDGEINIPTDVVIMNWNPGDYLAAEMIADGYTVINASWQPLYVVNNRKWGIKEIYNWSPTVWKAYQTPFEQPGDVAEKNDNIIGGNMCVWEQNQYKAFISLEQRLPAMAERLWNPDAGNLASFKKRLTYTQPLIKESVFPFEYLEKGLSFPDWKDSNFSEGMWFHDSLQIDIKPLHAKNQVRYTLDGSMPTKQSPILTESFIIKNNSTFTAQVFDTKKAVGKPIFKKYYLAPISLQAKGLSNNLKPHSWDRHTFTDSVQIILNTHRKGNIHITTNYETPSLQSAIYNDKLVLYNSGYLRAQLFDETGKKTGIEYSQEYEKVALEKSLTTGKPVTTSNKSKASATNFINDGRISRWDHWGAHTNGNNWVKIDLGEEKEIRSFKLYTFWDGYRYYEYKIFTSIDGENWELAVDQSANRKISVPEGQTDTITPKKTRYLKLQMIRNSANPGLHVVEFQVF